MTKKRFYSTLPDQFCYRTLNKQVKTFSAKTGEINQEWYLLDAEQKVLGRVAAAVAHRLRGKHKPIDLLMLIPVTM